MHPLRNSQLSKIYLRASTTPNHPGAIFRPEDVLGLESHSTIPKHLLLRGLSCLEGPSSELEAPTTDRS